MSSFTFKSLDAVVATGPGDALVFDSARDASINVQITFTGAPSEVAGRLERSLDGINWDPTGTFSADVSGHIGDFRDFAGPVVALRVNLTSITGGSSPTVSAIIAAVER